MRCSELYKRYGFVKSELQRALSAIYEPYITGKLYSLITDPFAIQSDEIIDDAMERLPHMFPDCEVDDLIFDCLRKRLTALFMTGSIQPKPKKRLLCAYSRYVSSGSAETYLSEELECIFSCFSRKTFTYFIDRYFYFDDSTPYSRKYERKIRKLFSGKGDVRPLYVWNRWKSHTPTPATYLFALNSLPDYFLRQISSEEDLLPHPEYDKYFVLTQRFLLRQKALPVLFVMFIVSMIVLLIQTFWH